jgi:excinuclease ABC subunit C
MTGIPEHIQSVLDHLPAKPGCYLMKDQAGKVIYVGKAVNLRSRVRSYYHRGSKSNPKIDEMLKRIADIEWIIVDSELEALILENNLIKKHQPHFNVRLKDDKTYPYIRVHWGDPFPKVTVTRRLELDGSRYFGPYTSVWAVHQTMDVLRRIFPFLTCDREITGLDTRACLYLDIKLCCAPCIGSVDQNHYRQMIDDLCNFLDGRSEKIVRRMKTEMQQHAKQLQFEKAASLRDQINAIEKVVEKQKVVSSEYIDSDVIALARSKSDACVQVFFIRGGKLVGRDYFMLEGAQEAQDSDVVAEFIKRFYDQAPKVPSQLLLPHEVEEAKIIKQWLEQKRPDQKIEIRMPRRGKERELIKMATENAVETLNSLKAQWESDRHRQEQALNELQEKLRLKNPLNRIECYDISNTQGTAAVGSMVVFEQGVPKKKLYRRFNIKSVEGPDDFASMEEVLLRRFNRWRLAQEAKEQPGVKPDLAFNSLPNLLVIDGGKGQLSRANKILKEFNLDGKIPVVGLAKQNEEIFFPDKPNPLLLPEKSQGFYLMQRIRDEAHRFAISSHRNKRVKTGLASRLEEVPGIGPVKRKALLGHFGSVEKIKNASLEELTSVQGINRELAQAIQQYL